MNGQTTRSTKRRISSLLVGVLHKDRPLERVVIRKIGIGFDDRDRTRGHAVVEILVTRFAGAELRNLDENEALNTAQILRQVFHRLGTPARMVVHVLDHHRRRHDARGARVVVRARERLRNARDQRGAQAGRRLFDRAIGRDQHGERLAIENVCLRLDLVRRGFLVRLGHAADQRGDRAAAEHRERARHRKPAQKISYVSPTRSGHPLRPFRLLDNARDPEHSGPHEGVQPGFQADAGRRGVEPEPHPRC